MDAVVLIVHGSRLTPATGSEFEQLAALVRSRLEVPIVTYGSLQFNEPDLAAAVAAAIDQGASRVAVVPVFLFQGNHVLEDIPKELAGLRERYPEVEIHYAQHLGPAAGIADLVTHRALEVLGLE